MVSFSSDSVLLLSSRHQKVIKWQLFLFQMIKFSLKRHHFVLNPHFEWKRVSFDGFLMTTWEPENKSQRKKKPQIPCPCLAYLIHIYLPNIPYNTTDVALHWQAPWGLVIKKKIGENKQVLERWCQLAITFQTAWP